MLLEAAEAVGVPDYVDENLSSLFDIIGYYYCVALISLSDYRQEDCIKMLWDKVDYHIENYDKKTAVHSTFYCAT